MSGSEAKHHPAVKKRGADAHVPATPKHQAPADKTEKKLEQGLEESMAGSDPPSITQPAAGKSS
jgi:hypothetical protein